MVSIGQSDQHPLREMERLPLRLPTSGPSNSFGSSFARVQRLETPPSLPPLPHLTENATTFGHIPMFQRPPNVCPTHFA